MSIWSDRTVIIGDNNGGGKLSINNSSPGHTLSLRQAGGTGIYIEEPASGTNWELRAIAVTIPSTSLALLYNASYVGQFLTNGNYISYSDKRLKTNIEKMPHVLPKILQLKPNLYEFKANNPLHEKSIGFIAQEVKDLFPELVFINNNPGGAKDSLENLHSIKLFRFWSTGNKRYSGIATANK